MKKIILLFCLMTTFLATAQVNWYIKPVASGFANGSSWANAIDLQTALANTSPGDILWLSSGTYKPHVSSRTTYFTISSRDLEIYGGFAGTETALSQRIFGANETILSGDLSSNDVNLNDYMTNYSNTSRTDNSHHILKLDYSANNILFDRITIAGAHNSLSASESGGAIIKYSTLTKLTLNDCIIRDNVSRNGNAGLLTEFDLNNSGGAKGELTIKNCKFINNMSRWGTGIYSYIRNNTDVDITISNTLFKNNKATDLNVSNLGLSGSIGWFRMLGNTSDVNFKFINNTVVNNLSSGTGQSLDATSNAILGIGKSSSSNGVLNAEVANNIFWNNKTTGNVLARSITDLYEVAVTSVNVYNSIDEANFNDNSITSTTNTSNSNPVFTSSTDFTLQDGSPALNSGDNSKIPAGITTDLAGNQRIINTNVDMGTYENTTLITTWIGSLFNSWSMASNWSNGVPTSTTNAIIPNVGNNWPAIRSVSMAVRNLDIQIGATLEIQAGKTLTIEGDLTQNGTFNISGGTSLSNQGSLILNGNYSGSGNVSYNREVTTNWHLLTSPVVGQNIAGIKNNVAVNGVKYAVAPYKNTLASSRYEYYTTAAGTNDINTAGDFVKGKGYSIKKASAGTLSFSGTLNTSDVSISISDGSATGNKWNLIGNPFTSSIQANSNAHVTNNFLTVNAAQLDPARVAIYVWNVSTLSYDVINQATSAKHLASSQGFFVESKNGGGSIQFTKAMQNHQGNSGSSSRISNTTPSIKLLVSNGDSQKSTDVKYFENSTTGLDLGYDAGVFSGGKTSFNVFTHLVSNTTKTNFALQCLPNSKYEDMVIPVGVNTKENTTLSFSVAAQNLPEDIHVYLEDKLNNTFTQIDKESHTVSFESKESGIGRFYVHTKARKPSFTDVPLVNELKMFVSNDNILKVFTKEINEKASIKIIDLLGKEVFTQKFVSKGVNEIALPNIATGIYIVRLTTTKEGKLSKKVLIK